MTKSKGLGDSIEKITKATGKDCGCNSRKNTLNKMFPYNPNGNWLSQRFR